MKKTQQRKEYFILEAIEETLNHFPHDTEKERFIKNIEAIISFLQTLKERVQSLPNAEDQRKVLLAIGDLTKFLQNAEKSPVLAMALGLAYEKKAIPKLQREEAVPQSVQPLLDELKHLPTEQIQMKLIDYKSVTMIQLRALASLLGIKYEQRIKRQDLVDKIVKVGFANIRGYEMLRSTGNKVVP